MLSRRDLVGKLAASGAVLWVAGTARASLAPSGTKAAAEGSGEVASAPPATTEGWGVDAETPATASVPAPWELIRPLAMGSVVAHGWKVAGLSGAVDGSCVLTLENAKGRSHRIHLCRNDGSPQGLVYTDTVDMLVMNGGQGDLATDEGFAQAVGEVAHVVAANERRQSTVVASLMPHDERLRRFTGADRRLR